MTDSFLRIHRFLVNQLFYPIFLSSVLAMAIFIVRVIIARSPVIYSNLVWNLALAWIPYAFGVLASGLHRSNPKSWWLIIIPGMIWLLFFPNAPYMVTDFLHLNPRPGIPLWYDILMLVSFSWTGIFLAIASLRMMQGLIKYYLGTFLSWLFAFFAIALSGLGIYLGRFERWNSWDMLTHPKSILKDLAKQLLNPLDSLSFFGFTMLITAFLFVCYFMFVSMRRLND
jgi:uncharacterized membrane protein